MANADMAPRAHGAPEPTVDKGEWDRTREPEVRQYLPATPGWWAEFPATQDSGAQRWPVVAWAVVSWGLHSDIRAVASVNGRLMLMAGQASPSCGRWEREEEIYRQVRYFCDPPVALSAETTVRPQSRGVW